MILFLNFLLISVVTLSFTRTPRLSSPFGRHFRIENPPNRFKNSFIDVSKFNFSGECADVFSHPPNSDRDYIVGSYDFRSSCVPSMMWDSLTLARYSMRNAHIVLLLFSFPPQKCKHDLTRLAKLNIELQKVEKSSEEDAVIARYTYYDKFIDENYKNISRIVFIDPRDVAFFNDFFATFSENDIGWLIECFGPKAPEDCFGPYSFKLHAEWLEQFYSKEVEDDFVRRKLPAVNGGFGYGGVEKMKKVLQIYHENADKTIKLWGYDQALLNVLYYNGSFDEVGMKGVICEQKLCYIGRNSMEVKDKVIYYNNTQCSPVAMHKFNVKSTQWKLW
ncbi:hypothetical protein EIN_448510 [Entamoeba invadens IP1]|uniref:Uncharacterized protein n=1 Tax=Entamoeba invadens IP1 TaxID=370355 RepID=L7FLT1_ENTIV|nr:hypothetical protein EIN_448510 [Entamoeba invadens IP1]ELP89090.1 hypothetical protein EIN_448510 [Entamoeba invadens IP1]|eukprot:XP_004255861.1 hypothetical protein EIN_448510 [Entamoeba invadens IP1]